MSVDANETQGSHVFTPKPGAKGEGSEDTALTVRATPCTLGHNWQQKPPTWDGPCAPGLHAWPSAPCVLPHHGIQRRGMSERSILSHVSLGEHST